MNVQPTLYKDEELFRLSERWNVARFVSLDSDLAPRFNTNGDTRAPWELQVENLLGSCQSVNVRTFIPGEPAQPFVYGLRSLTDVRRTVGDLANGRRLFIINETVDVADGGVSGVSVGGLVEFSPDATPRAVEGGDFAALPTKVAAGMLKCVYRIQGNSISFLDDIDSRIEFEAANADRVTVRIAEQQRYLRSSAGR